jgi:hypothetical protein
MPRFGWNVLGSRKNQSSTTSLPIHLGSESNNSASGTHPGGGSSSLRRRFSSFLCRDSNHSRDSSPTPPHTPQDPNASNSPVPTPHDFESERVQTPDTADRAKSNPIAASGGLLSGTTDTPSRPPRRSSMTESYISPTVKDHHESPNVQPAPHSEATAPPVVEEGPREKSWRDNLRTAYNGFSQVLNIAAESSDVFPPLKSVLGGVRAVLKAAEVRSH